MIAHDNVVTDPPVDKVKRLASTFGAALMMFGFSFFITCLGLLVPSGVVRFNVPVSAYLVQYMLVGVIGALMMPFIGRAAKRFGVRLPLILGSAWSAIWLIAMSFSTEIWHVYSTSIAMGLFWSFGTVVPSTILVNGWHNHSRRGLVFGIVMAGGAFGGVVAGIVMPQIVASFGWSGGFRAIAIVIAVTMTLNGVVLVRNPPNLIVAKTLNQKVIQRSQGLVLSFVLLMVAAVALSLESGFIQIAAPLFQTKGIDPVTAGLLVSLLSLCQIVLKPIGGAVFDKWGMKAAGIVLIFTYVIGFGGAVLVTGLAGVIVVIPFIAMSLTNHLVFIPLFVNRAVGTEQFATTYGTVMMAYYLGTSLGAPLWGLGFDLTGTFTISLIVALGCGVIGVLTMMMSVRLAQRRTDDVTPGEPIAEQATIA